MSSKALSRSQQVAGLTTLAAMLLAVVLDNTPARAWYDLVHHLPASVRIGTLAIDKPLILWINDGLMVFFFLLIALELKREIMEGQLSTPKSIAAPAFAALGGVAAPALIYTAFNLGDAVAMRGWAIPTATDTVLAVTVLVFPSRKQRRATAKPGTTPPAGVDDETDPSLAAAPCYRIRQGLWAREIMAPGQGTTIRSWGR